MSGDLEPTPYWSSAGISIYHGRWEEVLPQVNFRADTLLTDPPYGINYHSGHNSDRRPEWQKWRRKENFAPIAGDASPFDPTPWLHFSKIAIFGANYCADKLPPSKCWVIWDKIESTGSTKWSHDVELIWTNLNKQSRIYHHLWKGLLRRGEENVSRSPKFHPHQKPVALLCWLLQYAETTAVLDPFAGSGSTLVAAARLGIPAMGIELEETYCAVAAERLEKEISCACTRKTDQGES